MKRHPFSMVEILLALGVVAIGICSVMVLFPIGASATRDAAMETYAANAADQILHMVKYKLTMADNNNQWNEYISLDKIDEGKKLFYDGEPDSSSIYDLDDVDKWEDSSALIGGTTLMNSGIFPCKNNDYFYQIIVHRGNVNNGFSTVIENNDIDFRGLATLWASRVKVPGTTLPLYYATRLNLKIEWPLELPHEARQSAYYTLEVFNNK